MIIAVCDDDKHVLNHIERYINSFMRKMDTSVTIIKFDSGHELLWYLKKNEGVRLIFLDIRMPVINGLDVAKAIRKLDHLVNIVFVTSVAELATEGYKVDAIGYLLKPLKYSIFSTEMDRYLKKISVTQKEYLVLRTTEGFCKVIMEDVVYIETVLRKTLVHTSHGDRESYKTMKEYDKELGSDFFRCHRAYIVNLAYIREVVGLDVYLNDEKNTVIPVSKPKKNDLLLHLAKFFATTI